jgi:general secretion pathway protein H
MPTSAAGSKAIDTAHVGPVKTSQGVARAVKPALTWQASAGFTLIELLVVIAIIAIGTAAVSLSLRDSAQTVLERDAERLAALFESARARSRASGMPVQWHPVSNQNISAVVDAKGQVNGQANVQENGQVTAFVFEGLPPQSLPTHWLSPSVNVAPNTWVVLGPDPIIGPQSVTLQMNDLQISVSTDGLKPFAVKRGGP